MMTQATDTRASVPGRFSTITRYLKGYKGYLIFGAVAVVLSNVLLLINPYVLKIIFDKLENHAPASAILLWALLIVGLAIGSGVFRFLMRRTIIWMSRRIEYDLRGSLLDHLMKLSPSFYDRTRTGDMMARATNDLEAVRMMIGPGIMQIANTIVTVITALAFMIVLSPKLTLYAIFPMVMVPFIVNRLGNLVHRRFTKIQEHFSLLTAVAQENLAGVRVIKAYRQEEEEIRNFGDVSSQYVKLNLHLARVYGIMFPLMFFFASTLSLTVLYFGGLDVMNGKITIGTMAAFFGYLTMLFWPILAGGWVISLYQQGTASLDRINRILFTEPEIKTEASSPYAEAMKGKIVFRHLNFGYDTQKPVLHDINLTIQAGQTVGIVGPVGCGKTTLVSLLPRLYQPPRGHVLIDDVDVNDWDLHSLRHQIGFATQEAFLFSDSLANNVRFGEMGADMTRVQAAAETAALAKDVSLFPNGYETVVGERGITLSGGQKQRTAMARALLIEPAIVILDDATSAVDTETEDQINERIKSVRGSTTIIISHRVSSIREADIIVYLEQGRMVESGSHHELVALDGKYAELYRSQLLAMELEKM
jgi:ATP-binding cassette subfamily B protein